MDRGDQLAPTTRNTYSSTGKRSKKIRVRRRKRGSRAVEIADADRATYYPRYRHDLCLPTARFSNFVGVPFCLFRDKGGREKVHCHVRRRVPKKCSDCAEEAEWIDKTVARKTDVRMQLITTAVFAVGKNPRRRTTISIHISAHRCFHIFDASFIYPFISIASSFRRLKIEN